MIEINWGKPVSFDVTETGGKQTISTIEQAQFWLRKRWPVDDDPRVQALDAVRGAMDCLTPIESARAAFAHAARTAGFQNIRAH